MAGEEPRDITFHTLETVCRTDGQERHGRREIQPRPPFVTASQPYMAREHESQKGVTSPLDGVCGCHRSSFYDNVRKQSRCKAACIVNVVPVLTFINYCHWMGPVTGMCRIRLNTSSLTHLFGIFLKLLNQYCECGFIPHIFTFSFFVWNFKM